MATFNIILRRDDFVKLFDGSTMFDHVLHALGVCASNEDLAHEVSIEVPPVGPKYELRDEDGKRLLQKVDKINDEIKFVLYQTEE